MVPPVLCLVEPAIEAEDWLWKANELLLELVLGSCAARALPPVLTGLRIGLVMVGGLVTLVIIVYCRKLN